MTSAIETSARRSGGFSALPGIEKAAVILLILGEERAGQVLAQMDQPELIAVTRTMASIGKVPAELVNEACRVLSSKIAEGEVMVGSARTAERMLARFLPEDRVASIMEEIRTPAGRTTWEKLSSINPASLAGYLVGEGPQTAAVVLSRLSPEYAARVFESFDRQFTVDVTERMLDLDAVPRESIAEIEHILQGEFMANYGHGGLSSDPATLLAEIFNRTKGEVSETVLGEIGRERPADAARIQNLMFTFADLAGIDIAAASAIVAAVPREVMTMALKGAPKEVSERFFTAVNERVANIMRDEIQLMGPQRLRDVKAAQDEVLKTAKRLESIGEIVLKARSDDDRMID